MAWKVLSLLTVVFLGVACAFAYLNQKDLDAERQRVAFGEGNLKVANERKVALEEALKTQKAAQEKVQMDLQIAKEETVKLAAEAQEKEAALAVVKGNLEQVSQQVVSVEKQIVEAGDIPALLTQIAKYKGDQKEVEDQMKEQAARLEAAKSRYDAVIAQAAKLRETEAQGRKGIVEPNFTARVSQYFPEWDFAILSKGNSGGVFANADLEVKRGRNVIAKLKVRNVEQYGAIADLVPGSMAEGQSIRSGDTVVAAATQSVAKEASKTTTPEAAAGSATPPVTAPAPDAMAPAAPMASDPFGAAPAMGAPAAPAAPAMNSDPFGAAPAPAAAPGTPAAPNMTDPFAK